MPKYILIAKQRGGGCDYTIGCAMNYEMLQSPTLKKAIVEARGRINRTYSDEEYHLKEALVVELKHTIDVDQIYAKLDETKYKREEAKRDADERKQYEALKQKYGD